MAHSLGKSGLNAKAGIPRSRVSRDRMGSSAIGGKQVALTCACQNAKKNEYTQNK